MGDRTSVRLVVLESQKEAAIELFGGDSAEDYSGQDGTWEFCFYEVNYGNLDFLDELTKAGIAFDSHWDSGGDYTAGTNSIRFTPEGEVVDKTIYDESINPDLGTLMDLLDSTQSLREYILRHHDQVTSTPLDEDQVTYGKRYRISVLVGAV